MKVGIIRCMQTEDYCPGTADFMAIRNKRGSFLTPSDTPSDSPFSFARRTC